MDSALPQPAAARSESAWAAANRAVLERLLAHPRVWLCLLAALLLLPGTGSMPLMDRDEPRFARATVEMLERGDIVIPWFNGEYRFDKPPLTYWWMALHYKLLGYNELAARLHSVVAALGVALLLWAMGRRHFSAATGFWAGTAWLASFQVIAHGRLCVADMPMILAVTLSMWALLELLDAPGPFWRNRWFWLLGLGLGLGFLAKGPIALLVPLLALALTRLALWRKPLGLDWRALAAALLLATVLVGLWGIPALLRTHGEFWQQGVGKHVVQRGVDSFNGRVPLPFFYLGAAFLTLLPWLGRAGLALGLTRAGWSRKHAFLLGWLLVPYLIFSFYATQLPHYVLPGLGAFYLLLFQDGETRPWAGTASRAWFWFVHGLWIVVFGGLLIIAGLGAWPAPLSAFQEPVKLLVLLVLLLQAVALLVHARQLLPAIAALVLCAIVQHRLGQEIRLTNPALRVQQQLPPARPGERYLAVRFTEPSLVFYQGGQWTFIGNGAKARRELEKARKKDKLPRAIVLLEREWALHDHLPALLPGGPATPLPPTDDYSAEVAEVIQTVAPRSVSRFSGFNNGRTSWCELALLELAE
jgi:4-amino-4-deoxy-L-arabinose transferase-like glycosyltransferase